MAQSGDYHTGITTAGTGSYNPFGLAGAGYTAARPATATTAPTTATQPTYMQRLQQQYGLGGTQPQTQTGYNYNPSGFGLAGAGQMYQQQPKPTTPAPAATPAPAPAAPAATPSGTNPGGTYINGQWVPNITQTTTLSPQEQAMLTQQQNLTLGAGNLAGTLMGNVPTTAMNYSSAPAMPTTGDQPNQQAIDAVYQQQTNMLDPQWNQAEQQQRDSLRDQGIPEGSDAYNQAMTLFNNQKTTAYQQAKDAAVQEGYNVANQTFNQGMAARQQGVTEAQNLYQQPMNSLAALYSAYQGGGGVQMPQANYTPGQVSPTDVTGAVANYQNAQNQAYQNQANQYASTVGGISGLAGMLAMGALA